MEDVKKFAQFLQDKESDDQKILNQRRAKILKKLKREMTSGGPSITLSDYISDSETSCPTWITDLYRDLSEELKGRYNISHIFKPAHASLKWTIYKC